MSEQNKEIVRRLAEEVFNAHDVDAAGKFIADGFVEHERGFGSGLAGFKQSFTELFGAFPDLHAIIEDLVAERDKVVAHIRYRGTHSGEFMGVAPTGKPFVIHAIDILRLDDGKVVEHWGLIDVYSLLEQLGILPELS